MTRKFKKRPVVIEAIQYRKNRIDCIEFTGKKAYAKSTKVDGRVEEWVIVIPTLEGDMTASEGDWIIKGVEGEFYPCKPDIFEKTYEEVFPSEYSEPSIS